MASQFQHRVIGAVVLVALGVIILPGILDGDKRHYQNEFAAIPIIPSTEGNHPTTELPPANQALPDVVPDSGTTLNQTHVDTPITDTGNSGDNNTSTNSANNVNTVDSSNATNNTANTDSTANNAINSTTQNSSQTTTNQTAPRGKAYVVQLGAFKNVEGIEKIKAQLSFANYTVFTIPAKPVQGQTTRILVGPEVSRQKLQDALPELERLTGLKGVIREHTVTN